MYIYNIGLFQKFRNQNCLETTSLRIYYVFIHEHTSSWKIFFYNVNLKYYLHHERPCCIGTYKLDSKARAVYPFVHAHYLFCVFFINYSHVEFHSRLLNTFPSAVKKGSGSGGGGGAAPCFLNLRRGLALISLLINDRLFKALLIQQFEWDFS